jgi:hypothetical protein
MSYKDLPQLNVGRRRIIIMEGLEAKVRKNLKTDN